MPEDLKHKQPNDEEEAHKRFVAFYEQNFVSPGTPQSESGDFDNGNRPIYGSGEVPLRKTSEVTGKDGRLYWAEIYELDPTQVPLLENLALTVRNKLAEGAQFLGSISITPNWAVDPDFPDFLPLSAAELFFAREPQPDQQQNGQEKPPTEQS